MSKLNSTEGPTTEHQLKCVSRQSNTSSTTLDGGNPLNNEQDLDLYKEIVPIVTVIIVSVICNILMLYALYRTPHLRTVQNIFTVNLGLTDLCTTTIILPIWISTTISSSTSPFMCGLTGLLTMILLSVSIATLACISLDRHLSICYALQYPSEITSRRVYLMVGYIWIQGLVTAGTPLLGWGRYSFRSVHVSVCLPDWSHDKTYTLFMFTIGLLIPFVIMVYSYSKIMQVSGIITNLSQITLQIYLLKEFTILIIQLLHYSLQHKIVNG